jgi:Spy/CpxP family protein refolding chaperone
MKSISFRLLVAALAVTLGAALAKSQTADTQATPPPPMHNHAFGPAGHMIAFYSKMLNITDDQKSQMRSVLQKEHATMKPLMQQERQLDQQLKQYVEGTYDQAKVQALVSQQAQTLVQLKVEETRIHNELYQLLTPDQQAKLKEFEANRKARWQQHTEQAPPAAPEEQ